MANRLDYLGLFQEADCVDTIIAEAAIAMEDGLRNWIGIVKGIIEKVGNIPGEWGVSKEQLSQAEKDANKAAADKATAPLVAELKKLIPVAQKHIQIRENLSQQFSMIERLKSTKAPQADAVLAQIGANAQKNANHPVYGKYFRELLELAHEVRQQREKVA